MCLGDNLRAGWQKCASTPSSACLEAEYAAVLGVPACAASEETTPMRPRCGDRSSAGHAAVVSQM